MDHRKSNQFPKLNEHNMNGKYLSSASNSEQGTAIIIRYKLSIDST